MRRQICVLPPNATSAQGERDDLPLAGVARRCVHFDVVQRTDLSEPREARLLQTSDLIGIVTPSLRLQCLRAAVVADRLVHLIVVSRSGKEGFAWWRRASSRTDHVQGLLPRLPVFP